MVAGVHFEVWLVMQGINALLNSGRLPDPNLFGFMLDLLGDSEACRAARRFFEKGLDQHNEDYRRGFCCYCWWSGWNEHRLVLCPVTTGDYVYGGPCPYYAEIVRRLEGAGWRVVGCYRCDTPVVVGRSQNLVFCHWCRRHFWVEKLKSRGRDNA